MGKLKETIIDDDDYELNYDILEPDVPEYDYITPNQADWAIRDLQAALDTLDNTRPYEYINELKVASERLRQLISDIKAPF